MKKLKVSLVIFLSLTVLLLVVGAVSLAAVSLLYVGFVSVLNMMYWIGPFIFWFLVFVLCTIYSSKRKAVFFNMAAIFLALTCVDLAGVIWPEFNLRQKVLGLLERNGMSSNESAREEAAKVWSGTVEVEEDTKNFVRPSDMLGYAPRKSKVSHSYGIYDDSVLLYTQYTFDKTGLMITPDFPLDKNTKGIYFFGCSFTFGYGLKDQESVPHMVGEKTLGKYKVYNFAFNGYGTHQMVAALERGLPDSVRAVAPAHIFYVAIPQHMQRIVNDKDWGMHDPKFELNEQGDAVYDGHFDDHVFELRLQKLQNTFWKMVHKSNVLRSTVTQSVSDEQVDLFIALIRKARDIAQRRYPASQFHVVYWDYGQGDFFRVEPRILEALEEHDINYYRVSNILPGYTTNLEQYWIAHPIEHHPNAMANSIISNFLLQNVIFSQ